MTENFHRPSAGLIATGVLLIGADADGDGQLHTNKGWKPKWFGFVGANEREVRAKFVEWCKTILPAGSTFIAGRGCEYSIVCKKVEVATTRITFTRETTT